MRQNKFTKVKKQIQKIKQELQTIEEMRPGSLTCQYHSPKDKRGAFYQLSYTHNMKSRTDYVKLEFISDLKRQIKNYKRFRKLTKKWVDLSIKHSKLKIALSIKNK